MRETVFLSQPCADRLRSQQAVRLAVEAGSLLDVFILYFTFLFIVLFNTPDSQASEKNQSKMRERSRGDQASGTMSFLLARSYHAVSLRPPWAIARPACRSSP